MNNITNLYIGQIVHYYAYGTPNGEFPSNVPRAALITAISDENNWYSDVSLCVLNPTGIYFNQKIKHTNSKEAGCWSRLPI